MIQNHLAPSKKTESEKILRGLCFWCLCRQIFQPSESKSLFLSTSIGLKPCHFGQRLAIAAAFPFHARLFLLHTVTSVNVWLAAAFPFHARLFLLHTQQVKVLLAATFAVQAPLLRNLWQKLCHFFSLHLRILLIMSILAGSPRSYSDFNYKLISGKTQRCLRLLVNPGMKTRCGRSWRLISGMLVLLRRRFSGDQFKGDCCARLAAICFSSFRFARTSLNPCQFERPLFSSSAPGPCPFLADSWTQFKPQNSSQKAAVHKYWCSVSFLQETHPTVGHDCNRQQSPFLVKAKLFLVFCFWKGIYVSQPFSGKAEIYSFLLSFAWQKFMFSGCQRKFRKSWISVMLSLPWRKFMFSTCQRKFGKSWISVVLSFPWRKFIFQHVNGNSKIHEFL